MTITDLATRFVWTPDKPESWRILDTPTGALHGDCDDFAVTALWIAEGHSLWRFWWALFTFRAVVWFVWGTGFASHVVLWHRKHGWIDNQNRAWGPRKHTLCFPTPLPVVAVKLAIGKMFG